MFLPLDTIDYKRRFEPTIFHQTSGNLLVSIIATHDSDLATKGSKTYVQDTTSTAQKLRSSAIRSTQSLNLTSSSSRSVVSTGAEETMPEEATPKLKTRFEILTEKIEAMKEKVEDQEEIFRQLSNEKKEQKKSIDDEVTNLEQLKKDKKLKMQVAMLLDNPEESKEKLEQSLEIASKKRENLNSRFESHKKPLEEHLASFKGSNAIKLQKAEEKIVRIKQVKRLIKEIQEDVINKTDSQLQIELSQIKRVTKRSAYTSRIVDIIKSIKKQNKDIDEILKDTKMLQKAINSLEGQLQRQFTVTEDLIWNNVSFVAELINGNVHI